MSGFVYPDPKWLEESAKLYNEDFEKKLAKLSGSFAYNIHAEPAWGIDEDLYMVMKIKEGKLEELKACSKDYAYENADYVMGATPQAWKKILTKKDKFVGAFMGGRVKLEKGDTVGALALGPHANNLVDSITQVELRFPDDLPADELESFKAHLKAARAEIGA